MRTIIIGDGIGCYERGCLDTENQSEEILYEKVNIRAIAVDEKNKDFIQKLIQSVKPDLAKTIAFFTIEEIEKFDNEFKKKREVNKIARPFICDFIDTFGRRLPFKCSSKSMVEVEVNRKLMSKDSPNNLNIFEDFIKYHVECSEKELKSEKIIKSNFHKTCAHFSQAKTFFAKAALATIKKWSIFLRKSIYNVKDLRKSFDIDHYDGDLNPKQKFCDARQIKDAIAKGEKIDSYDPILHAVMGGIHLDEEFPIAYAIQNGVKIEGRDPTLWAQENEFETGQYIEPIVYAITHGIKIEGKDPTLWAQENKYKIKKIDPIVYAINGYGNKKIKIKGLDAEEWIDDIIKKGKKIDGMDAKTWIYRAVEEAIKIKIQDSEESSYTNLIRYAIEHNIQIEGLDAKKWMDTIGNKRIEDEKKNRKDTLHSVVSVEQPKQPPVVEEMQQEPEIEQPQKSPISTPSSPTVDKEDSKPKSNSRYSYIGICATVGLCIGYAIGCVTAYFLGAASLTPMVVAIAVFAAAAVVGMVVGAAFGAGIGYCVSRCFDNPNVEEHKQLLISS